MNVPFRVQWLAPDRLRIDQGGMINLHIGRTGCISGRVWVCGRPDTGSFPNEVRAAVLSALFRNMPGYPSDRLRHMHVQTVSVGPRLSATLHITARGDPWFWLTAGSGGAYPGPSHESIDAARYTATIQIDARGRPSSLRSTLAFPSDQPGVFLPARPLQRIHFSYGGNRSIEIPSYPRIPCPSWDRSRGSWCLHDPNPGGQ